jgi:hypothetical protein
VSFWNKLFGAKESPKVGTAKKESTQPHATSNPHVASILDDAVRNGNLEPLKELLRENPGLVLGKTENGTTLLHVAAAMGQTELVELLLANRADVSAEDNGGRTALDFAFSNGHMDVVKLLPARAPRFRLAASIAEQIIKPDLPYLLSVEDPTVLPGDYRDANRDEPAFLASKFRSGIQSFYSMQAEAQGRLARATRFSSMVQSAMLELAQEDLGNLALKAKSTIVRAAAAKRMAELQCQHGGHE